MPKIGINCEDFYCSKLAYVKNIKQKEIYFFPNNTNLDFANFLFFLPNNYQCDFQKTSISDYSIRINITLDNKLIFHVYVDKKFEKISAKLDENGYLLNWKLEFIQEKNSNFFIFYLPDIIIEESHHNYEHPFIKVGRKIVMSNEYQINQNIIIFYNNKMIQHSIKFHNHYLQKNSFIKFLNDNFKGSFKIYQTLFKNDKYVKLENDHYLFGLSWVLPWTGSIIKQDFNCFMIDTTFKAVSPYTLTIFNVIHSNNSIPVCISISPSEKWISYDRAYKHLTKYLRDININKNLLLYPFLSDKGKAIKKFSQINYINLIYCHRHIIENFGSSTITANWVMRILKTNTSEEYQKLRIIIINEINLVYPNLLFKFGNVYIKNSTINNDKLDKLLQMLDVIGIRIDEDFHKRKWARWMRYGCPTTTNAIESIHSHINANIPIKGTFLDKLQNVQKCLNTRYENYHKYFGRNFKEYI